MAKEWSGPYHPTTTSEQDKGEKNNAKEKGVGWNKCLYQGEGQQKRGQDDL